MKRLLTRKTAFFFTFLAGMALGFLLGRLYLPKMPHEFFEVRSGGYRYIRPLLECEPPGDSYINRELRSFRAIIEKEAQSCVDEGLAGELSVYFRDLNNGPWFSLNPQEKFVPASLLKVPLLITALRLAEKDASFLDRQVVVPKDFPVDWGQTIRPQELLKPGNTYTVRDLLRRMIDLSDNGATAMLDRVLPPGAMNETFADLGVEINQSGDAEGFLSVEKYASFFRVLYNASYVSRSSSEYALSLLSEVDFPEGIRAGTPAWIPVAQKFGHWQLPPQDPNPVQIHDCGIVYHPDRPYLLAVMTRGNEIATLDKTIARISAAVYREVDAQTAGWSAGE